MPRAPSNPSYRRHKASGQAVVTLPDGYGGRRDVLLGAFGSAASRAAYDRVLAEWLRAGRRVPDRSPAACLSINELILLYWEHAETYYRKHGEPTTQLGRIKAALKPLRELYGPTSAVDFGPRALKAVRDRMLHLPCGHCKGTGSVGEAKRPDLRRSGNTTAVCRRCRGSGVRGWARDLVNSMIGCVKRVFKWAAAEELLPAHVFHGLQAVEGLRKGRSSARETEDVRPVDDAQVAAVLPLLTPPVAAMVKLQRASGMRPGEVVLVRPCDVERPEKGPWIYRPARHKTEHHRGSARVVQLGPKAREALTPFLDRDPEAFCFSPAEALAAHRAAQRAARKTKVQPSQADRRKARTVKKPGPRYTTGSYRAAVERACLKAGVAPWHVNQLRHAAATEIRRTDGLDAARAVLGHRTSATTEVYAEVDAGKAAQVMERIG